VALLREINQAAAVYFHHLFRNSDEAARARAYLAGRGLNAETLETFQVGYALDQWDATLRYLKSKGYAEADLAEAGVIIEREQGGYYDRFRKRVVFPIRDHMGRTIGFGGRVLGDGVPKYLNSPQTPLFDKSSVLFGLDQAKQGIRVTGEAVIVEGYMDVLMAHQHGINNVVAQMGTALTEAQLKLLQRFTQTFVLALDSDAAGDRATLRGLDVARQVMDREAVPVPTPRGLIRFEDRLAAELRIVTLPPGRDPDEVIHESPARWAQLMAQAKPVMDYYFQALTADLDLGTAQGKAEAVRVLGPLIVEVGDRVQRTHYLQRLARMVQVDERSLWQQVRHMGGEPQPRRYSKPTQPIETPKKIRLDLDEHCLSLLLIHPSLFADVDAVLQEMGEQPIDVEDLTRSDDKAIFVAWHRWIQSGGAPETRAAFYDTLDENLQDRLDILIQAREDQPEVPEEMQREDIRDTLTRLRLRNLRRRMQELRFLLEDTQDSDVGAIYGPLITQATTRIRRLQKGLNERSISGRRRHDDAPIRVPLTEE
jgi:DNA primase